MWNPEAYLEQLYARHHRGPAQRERLAAALGSFGGAASELSPVLLEQADCGDHLRERVEFSTCEGLRVPAYVLIPKGRPCPLPAVLALHGHGYGSREIVGVSSPTIAGNFALELVQRGMLVLAPEVIGFGDRRLAADMAGGQAGNSSCYTLATHLLMYGKTLAGLRVFEARRALDYLATRPDVDASRLGCMGFSGGGMVAAYTSALDDRVKATVLCGFTNTYKGSILAMHHCICNYVPGILLHAELPDVIGLIAPRRLFVESGEEDPIFPVGGAREALAELEARYTEAGAPDRLQADIFPGKHEVSGREAYAWLARSL